jgi:hypothetical protein
MISTEINVIDQRKLIPLDNPKARVIWKNKSSSNIGYLVVEESSPTFSVDANKVMYATEISQEFSYVFRSINYQPVFAYLLASGTNLILKNGNGLVFAVAPDSRGIMKATETTFSGDLRTSDLDVGVDMFGFIQPTGTRQVYIDNRIVKNKLVNNSTATVFFSSLAFEYGSGPVFNDGVTRYRLVVTNNKAVASQQL